MVKYNFQAFKDSLTSDHLNGGFPALQKYGITHNHSELVYDYQLTDHYKKRNSFTNHLKYADEIWEESGHEIWERIINKYRYWLNDRLNEHANTQFIKENTFGADKLIEISVLRYAEYLSVWSKGQLDQSFRFGPNKLKSVLESPLFLEEFELLYSNYNNALNNIFPEKFEYQNLCAYCWILLEANHPEDVIEITSYYFNQLLNPESYLINHYTDSDGKPKGLDNLHRAFLSISWPLVQALKHLKRYDEALLIYEKTKRITKDQIHYSTGRNRVLEAAIEAYKISPTLENKEWCYKMLYEVTKVDIDNNSENVNEIFLIFYMFYKHVLGKELT